MFKKSKSIWRIVVPIGVICLVIMIFTSFVLNSKIFAKTTPSNVKQTSNSSTDKVENNNLPKNIVIDKVPEAEAVPQLFYKYLNNKEYDKAIDLLSPNLKFEGDPANIKYLENIEHTDFIEFKDITTNFGYLDSSQQNYYAVKVYYAELKMQVKDKNLVPALLDTQYRRMVVVKLTKDGPWLLDADESMDKMN